MTAISDERRLRIYRIVSVGGELKREEAADIWQDKDGNVVVSGLWDNGLIASQEDLSIQAAAVSLSPLEYLRLRLLPQVAVAVEVVG